ncbi:MAG: RND family transporter [candidate division Zixibacteria bacterium]|nr:RND family transporter [candidate division Zixibacteria bacterium]
MVAKLLDILIKARWLVIILVTIISAFLFYSLKDLRYDTSTEGSIPENDPSQKYFELVKEDFGNDQVAMAVVVAKGELGIFEPNTLIKIRDLTERIGDIESVDNVVSLTNSTFLSGMGGEELRNDPIIPYYTEDRDSAENLKRVVLKNSIFHKTLVSEDGSAAAINIFLSNVPDSILLGSGIDDSIKAIVANAAGPEKTYYAGIIHTRTEMSRIMRRDLAKFIPVAFILILIILFASFRSIRGILIPALTIAIAVAWTFGLLGRFNVPISTNMIIIPPLLIAIACSMTIHIISQYNRNTEQPGERKNIVRNTFETLFSPLTMAGLTTAIGFGSLMASPIPNIQKVGIFSVIGILITILVSFTFVPAILSLIKLPKIKEKKVKERDFMSPVIDFVVWANLKHRWLIVILSLGVLVLSIIGMFKVKVDTDFLSFFKQDSDVRLAADAIGENLAGVSTFYVVATADTSDTMRDAKVLQGIDSLQTYMESMPEIDKATSLVNIIKLFHQAMNHDNPDSFIITSNQEILDGNIILTIDSEAPKVRSHYVVEDYSSMSIFARSQMASTSDLSKTLLEVEKAASEILPENVTAIATGTIVVLAKSISHIVKGQRDSLLLAFGIIFIIMSILFKSIRVGLLSMIPNMIPILVIFGIMGWFGLSLNTGTTIVASISLGIAIDDTIHYLMHFRRAVKDGKSSRDAVVHCIKTIGRPVIFTSLALCLGFMVICLSEFGMLVSVGILTAVTMITCLISDLFLTSALLLSVDFSEKLKKGK